MKIILFMLLLVPGLLRANHKLEEELNNKLSQATTDSARVDIICELSDNYFLSDAQKARKHALIAADLATKINYLAGKGQALILVGYSHMVAGENDQALKNYYQALHLGEQSGKLAVIARSYLNIGIIYRKLNDPARAIQNYRNSLKVARKGNDSLAVSKVYNSLGNIYEEKKLYAKALEMFKKAAKLQESLGHKRSLATSLHNIGNVHYFLKQPAKGLPYLFQSLRINDEIHNEMIKIATLGRIAKLYKATGQAGIALKYAHQSYSMAMQTNSSKRIMAAAELLEELYVSGKNYEQAYKYATIYHQHNEILKNQQQQIITTEVTTKYENHKKDLENKALKAQREKQEAAFRHQQLKLIFGMGLLTVMLVLVLVLYANKRYLKDANRKLQEANTRMQLQNEEINRQKEEISSQTDRLKIQNEQLEKDNNFKNKIFSIISHDLRSPFISMSAFINLMQAKNLVSTETKPIFDMFGRDIDIITNMINNLLAWSKTQLTGDKLNMELTDLYFLAEENVDLTIARAKEKSICIINDVPDDTMILTDKERLNIVIRNLLANAVKFTPSGGEIRLHVQEQLHAITLVVSDNGMGIPEKYLTKLFAEQRFTTLGTSKEKGTGLGLMLCKELIDGLRGRISVESQEGKGSSFSVVLPKKLAIDAIPQPEQINEPYLIAG